MRGARRRLRDEPVDFGSGAGGLAGGELTAKKDACVEFSLILFSEGSNNSLLFILGIGEGERIALLGEFGAVLCKFLNILPFIGCTGVVFVLFVASVIGNNGWLGFATGGNGKSGKGASIAEEFLGKDSRLLLITVDRLFFDSFFEFIPNLTKFLILPTGIFLDLSFFRLCYRLKN